MSSCLYDRVFTAPAANDAFGKRPNPYHPEPKKPKSKISIAWWLVPSVIVYMMVSALMFG